MQTNNVVMIFGHIFAENKPERAVVQLFFPSLIGPPADQAAGVTLSELLLAYLDQIKQRMFVCSDQAKIM